MRPNVSDSWREARVEPGPNLLCPYCGDPAEVDPDPQAKGYVLRPHKEWTDAGLRDCLGSSTFVPERSPTEV